MVSGFVRTELARREGGCWWFSSAPPPPHTANSLTKPWPSSEEPEIDKLAHAQSSSLRKNRTIMNFLYQYNAVAHLFSLPFYSLSPRSLQSVYFSPPSVCPSVYLPVCLSARLSVSVCASLSLYICLSLCFSSTVLLVIVVIRISFCCVYRFVREKGKKEKSYTLAS